MESSVPLSSQSATTTGKLSTRMFTPFTASEIDRYNRGEFIPPDKEFPWIDAAQRSFEHPSDLSSTGWKVCTHPEGAPYFCDIQRRIYTDTHVRNPKKLGTVEKCISRLSELAAFHSITFPSPPSSPSLELVLELANGKSRKECRYYFVDTEKRLLFWVHGWVPEKMYANLRGVKKQSHIKMALEMQYWTHCELYPRERTFDAAVYRELYGLVIHANAESITSDTSLAPFESAELSKMMDIVRILQDSVGQVNDPVMCVVARFMCIFSRIHFLNFHGQPCARLDVDHSIYYPRNHRLRTSFLLHLLSFLLFGAPWRYVETLRGVWVDETVNLPRWKAFVARVIDEWGGFTIYSTVMLAVDISLLGIADSDSKTYQSVTVIAIYVSVICTVGSIVASVVLTGMWRDKAENAEEVAKYMNEITDTVIGVDHMAIMFSVPFGLLIWGMTSFLVAFLYLIYSSTYLPTLATTTPGIILVAVLVAWPVWVAVERGLGGWIMRAVDIWRQQVVRTGWHIKGWGEQGVRSWRERERSAIVEIRRGNVGMAEPGILDTGRRQGSASVSSGREGRMTVSFVETGEDVKARVGMGAVFGTGDGVQDLQASEDVCKPQLLEMGRMV
ncbi:hypothetical protein F5J12DRAFT_865135 [Pisolithus orientalis]|uniref:uncharacterized protein n=1 Tax=Pisolithus orientalis TaxID=936130 RepID=UPI0022254DCA|nr:uncharacterized protein F5J12DRAFT_865135 [Pisolithus orientalis]KAI5988840.1 hypothetical protein F5J12DRAFT_865135 [Pisolithus orientalis]